MLRQHDIMFRSFQQITIEFNFKQIAMLLHEYEGEIATFVRIKLLIWNSKVSIHINVKSTAECIEVIKRHSRKYSKPLMKLNQVKKDKGIWVHQITTKKLH